MVLAIRSDVVPDSRPPPATHPTPLTGFERMWHRIDESQKLQLVFRVEVTVYDPNAPNRNPSPHR